MVNYICFDTETSGIDHTKYNLLTVHFIILNQNLEKIDSLDLKIKHPHYTVHPKALEINKIDIVSHTKDTKSLFISDANKLLLEFLNNNKQHYKYIPIGHNVNFDIQFIKSSGLLSELDYFKYISHIPLDTLSIAGFLKLSGYLPPTQLLNLVSLCKYLHINYPGPVNNSAHGAANISAHGAANISAHGAANISAHNAEYDATMTVELLKVFKKFIDVDKTYLSSNKRKRED